MTNRPSDFDTVARMLAALWSLPHELQMGTMATVFDAFVRVDRSPASTQVIS